MLFLETNSNTKLFWVWFVISEYFSVYFFHHIFVKFTSKTSWNNNLNCFYLKIHFVIKKYWFSLTFSDSWIRFTLGTTLILLSHSWVITIKFSQHGHSSQQHWLLIEKLPKQSGSCNLTVFSEPKVLSSTTIFSLKKPFLQKSKFQGSPS